MVTRRSPLGPWFKVYTSVVDTKAHYSDEQFRALIEAWAFAVRQPTRGLFPNRSALDRRVGRENVDFLISQGDLDVFDDGHLEPHRWPDYQAGVLSTDRKKPTEAVGGEPVDSSGTVPELFGNAVARARSRDARLGSRFSTLESPDTPNVNGEAPRVARAREALPEPMLSKAQFEAWQSFGPEWNDFKRAMIARGFKSPPSGSSHDDQGTSQRSMLWPIIEAQPRRAARVLFESKGSTFRECLDDVLKWWDKLRDDVDRGKPGEPRRQPKRQPKGLSGVNRELAEMLRATEEPDLIVPVDPETGRQAWAAMRGNGSSGNGLTKAADLLPSSVRSAPAPAGHSLTVDRDPDAQSAAAGSKLTPSLPDAEPGEFGPDRVEAPDGRERLKENPR